MNVEGIRKVRSSPIIAEEQDDSFQGTHTTPVQTCIIVFFFGDFVILPSAAESPRTEQMEHVLPPLSIPIFFVIMQSLQPLYFFIESVALSMPLSAKKCFDITDFRFMIYWLRCSIVCTRMSSMALLLLVSRINNVLGSKENIFLAENALKFQWRYVYIKGKGIFVFRRVSYSSNVSLK